jgi:hypothetical protein
VTLWGLERAAAAALFFYIWKGRIEFMGNREGRNKPCPCGSGKKYKKCHLETNQKNTTRSQKPQVREISVLRTMSHKGLPNPLAIRLFFGLTEISNHVITHKAEKEAFNKIYGPFADSIWEAGYCKDKVREIVENHTEKVESGEVAKMENSNQLNVEEDIAIDLKVAFKGIFLHGRIALSYLGKIAKELGYDLNFIYENEQKFEKGISEFVAKHDSPIIRFIAERIRVERASWYSIFIQTRIEIEHKGWQLPEIKYTLKNGRPAVIFPTFSDNLSMVDGTEFLYRRLFEFSEDVIALLLGSKLPPFFALVHIPENERDESLPKRYVVTPIVNLPKEVQQVHMK